MSDPLRQRYKLIVSYRGTQYHGWQFQYAPPTWKGAIPPEGRGLPTVQDVLTRAIARVVNERVTLRGSSRTDAGVHAKGQVVQFDMSRTRIQPDSLRRAVNHQLPDDVLVRSVEPVEPDFDCIRWTRSKRYQYCIWHDEDRPPFFADMVWHRRQEMDVDAMRAAAREFVGTHDFASFTKPGHSRETTIRTVLSCDVSYRKPRLVIGVEGTGFLWNMVRIMVGTLVDIGVGRREVSVPEMLEARNRTAAGPTAPPVGLYLQWIKFGQGAMNRYLDE